MFRAARFALICWEGAHSWVHRTRSWEVTTALSSHHWGRCSGIHKNLNKKLHISLQMLHDSLPHHSSNVSLQLTQVYDLLAPILHWFHINKQQLHEACTPSKLTIPVFNFSEGFLPSLWLKSVQNLKRNSWAIFVVESSMKLMLDLLHPKPSGLYLPLPYLIFLPWWALNSYIPDLPSIFATNSFLFSFSLHPQHTIFSGSQARISEAWDLQVLKKNARKPIWSFSHWFIDTSVLIFTWGMFQEGPTTTLPDQLWHLDTPAPWVFTKYFTKKGWLYNVRLRGLNKTSKKECHADILTFQQVWTSSRHRNLCTGAGIFISTKKELH